MKSSIKAIFVTSFFLILSALPARTLAGITIAYPPDQVIVNQSTISLVGTCDEEGLVSVTVRGGSSPSGDQVPIELDGFRVALNLSSGTATITVTAPSGASDVIRIAFGKKPEGFREWNVHSDDDRFANCSDCHRVSEKRKNYKRMAMGTESCASGKCHSDFGVGAEFVHGPVAGGVCISCHNPHGSLHKASITRTGAEQCLVCHEDKRDEFQQTHQHTPIKDGDCTGCHDPHQSDHQYQLREEGQELCFICHDRTEKIGGAFLHGPLGAGECNACHDPHASPFSYQLMAEGNDVCYACHEQKLTEMQMRHRHPPAEESCTNCHGIHSAPAQPQLIAETPGLCYECHDDIEETVAGAAVQHPPVAEGRCTECHSPHASDEPLMMQQEMVQMCGSCHEDMGEKLATGTNRHGPVQDNDCGACHAPHGGGQPTLLAEFFPPAFYNPYREDLYSLCFQCHNADIARDPETTTLTNFRDGERNLHYLHINKRKGRSCKACHEIHASDQAAHIRRSVPFGDLYEYPVNYTQTEDGGSCVVGCHKPKSYSRTKRGRG